VDLINPSPSIGWSNQERPSFLKRSSFDLTLCLAFLHHLAIANNLPFSLIAQMFSEHTKHLVIEFVPKVDSNAKRLLQNREDIFDQYYQGEFEQQFSKYFMIKERASIDQSLRVIYLMTRKD
jgi:hypothetical protein